MQESGKTDVEGDETLMADREKVISEFEDFVKSFSKRDDTYYKGLFISVLSLLKEQETDKKDVEYMPMEAVPVTIGNDYRTWRCSACGSKLQYGKELICPKCHRKIDWEGR